MKEMIILQLELKLEMQIFPGERTPASETHAGEGGLVQWGSWESEDTHPRPFLCFGIS